MARHYCNNKVANQAANKFDSIHFKMACFVGGVVGVTLGCGLYAICKFAARSAIVEVMAMQTDCATTEAPHNESTN